MFLSITWLALRNSFCKAFHKATKTITDSFPAVWITTRGTGERGHRGRGVFSWQCHWQSHGLSRWTWKTLLQLFAHAENS